MDDIVKRIRQQSYFGPEPYEAANEIEQLRQRVQELENECESFREAWNRGDWPATFVNEQIATLTYEKWGEDQARIAKLTAERDELLAVLEQIVAANPRKWEELAEPQSEFERWAKSRANHAIASVKEKA